MSWSRKFSRAGFALALLGALGACGFQPLYGKGANSVSLAELDSVQIPHLREREGQMLRTMLMHRFNPDGRRGETRYVLDISLVKTVSNVGVRRDATATRANLTLNASFALRDAATGKPLHTGSSASTVSYNILDERFATVAAEQDAVERAARAVADNLKLRISTFLQRRDRAA